MTDKRRRLAPQERRHLIVEAAGRLFGEHGYDGTRLDDVAAAAGVTKPVLYRHFADKTALYLALLERHREDLGSFAGAVPASGTLEERLRAVLDVWLDYVQSHAYAWKMLFRDSGGGQEIQAVRRDVHARARATLVELVRAFSVAPLPPHELEPLAEMLSMGQASLVLWWMDDPTVPRDAIIDAIARVWHGVLTSGELPPARPGLQRCDGGRDRFP
jgi:AcrR family transcriptional regulator